MFTCIANNLARCGLDVNDGVSPSSGLALVARCESAAKVLSRGELLLLALGSRAPAVNVALFALYHLWSPWVLPGRVLALLPMTYTVWRRRNIYLGITVHCALNTIGTVVVLPQIL